MDSATACQQCREGLSALADSEPTGMDAAQVDDHLAGCAACQTWLTEVDRVRRGVRLRTAMPVPDLTERILTAAALSRQPRRPRAYQAHTELGRGLLALIAGAQLLMGFAQLVGIDRIGDVSGGEGMHLFDESTAWNLAVGVGFAVAALWPRRAPGLLPTMTVFVVVLAIESVIDLIAGRAVLLRETSHLLVVVGLALLWLVAWPHVRWPRPFRADRMPTRTGFGPSAADDLFDPAVTGQAEGGTLRPAGRHVA